MNNEKQFMTKVAFAKLIENAVINKRLSYLDAIIYVCEKKQIDPTDAKKFIGPSVKSKLEAEAMELNLLPKQNTLSFE